MVHLNRRRTRSIGPIVAALVAAGCLGVATPRSPGQQYFQSSAQVYIDDAPAVQVEVDDVETLIAEGRFEQAAGRLQPLIERHGDELVRVGNNVGGGVGGGVGVGGGDAGEAGAGDGAGEGVQLYVSVRGWAARVLRDHADVRTAYAGAHGSDAAAAANRARELLWQMRGEALVEVVERYPDTAGAEQAGLDLAAWSLERGQGRAALSALGRLMQASQRGERYEQLHAAATAVAGDDAVFAAAWALRPEGERKGLESLRRSAMAAGLLRGGDGAERQVEPSGPVELETPLWTFGESAPRDAVADARLRMEMARRSGIQVQGGAGLVVPRLSGGRVYLNSGGEVVALDRWSGRAWWVYRDDAGVAEEEGEPRAAGFARDRRGRMQSQGIARSVGVGGGRVYAVLGPMEDLRVMFGGPIAAGNTPTRLAAVDEGTGAVVWSIQPGDLSADLADARFDGTPMWDGGMGEGRVYVLVRRVRAGGFQDTVLASVEAGTGKTVWTRHVSSTVLSMQGSYGTAAGFIVREGVVYICDNVGAAAAIDGRSGRMLWLQVAASERGEALAVVRNDPVPPEPVLVEAGLIVPLAVPGANLVVLDPATGLVRRELGRVGDVNWPQGVRAMGGEGLGGDVLALSPRMARLDGTTLEPRWETVLNGFDNSGGIDPAEDPLGAVAMTSDELLYSTSTGLGRMDLETGKLLGRSMGVTGHLAARGQQVVVVTPDGGVRAYMGWEAARAGLLAVLEQRPLDPMPGVSLADLAVSRDRPESVMEGVDAAVAALDRRLLAVPEPDRGETDRGREAVVDLMVRLARPSTALSLELRGRVLDAAATTVVEPAEAAAYTLAKGLWLEQSDRPGEAVDLYQAVLLDPALSAAAFRGEQVTRRAGLEARSRLESLMDRLGPGVYARQEAEAAVRLAVAVREAADTAALIELAAVYPVSDAAGRALIEAGQALATAHLAARAEGVYRDAYGLRGITPQTRAAVVAALAEHYLTRGEGGAALRWLRQVKREHPSLRIQRQSEDATDPGAPVSLDAWIEELAQKHSAKLEGPRVELPLIRLTRVDGRGYRVPPDATGGGGGMLFINAAGQVVYHDADDLKRPRWTAQLGDAAEMAEVAGVTRGLVLVLLRRERRLVGVDLASGGIRWQMNLEEMFDPYDAALAAAHHALVDRPGLDQQRNIEEAVVRLQQGLNGGGRIRLKIEVNNGERRVVQEEVIDVGPDGQQIRQKLVFNLNGQVQRVNDEAQLAKPAVGLLLAANDGAEAGDALQVMVTDAGVCIVGSKDAVGMIVGLDVSTGSSAWSSPLPTAGTVLATAAMGDLGVAIVPDPTQGGNSLVSWSLSEGRPVVETGDLGQEGVSWMAISPDGVLLVAQTGGVNAFAGRAGGMGPERFTHLWSKPTPDQPVLCGWLSGEAAARGVVGVVGEHGRVMMLDLRDGGLIGDVTLPMPAGQVPSVVRPVGGDLCLIRIGSEVAAISPTGEALWRAPAEGIGLGGGVAAAAVGEGQVLLLTGHWNRPTPDAAGAEGGADPATPMVQVLDAGTGRILDEYATPRLPHGGSPRDVLLQGGGIVIVGDDGSSLVLQSDAATLRSRPD